MLKKMEYQLTPSTLIPGGLRARFKLKMCVLLIESGTKIILIQEREGGFSTLPHTHIEEQTLFNTLKGMLFALGGERFGSPKNLIPIGQYESQDKQKTIIFCFATPVYGFSEYDGLLCIENEMGLLSHMENDSDELKVACEMINFAHGGGMLSWSCGEVSQMA